LCSYGEFYESHVNFLPLYYIHLIDTCNVKWRTLVSKVTGCELDDPASFSSRGRERISLFVTVFRQTLGPTQPPVHVYWGFLSLGLKQLEHETHYLLPSSSEVKNLELTVNLRSMLLEQRQINSFYTLNSCMLRNIVEVLT
jgi:hypothetical protein